MKILLSTYRFPAIYKITNSINGKIYIGQSQNFYLRYLEHAKIRGNGSLQKAFKKYGFEKFEFHIIERTEIDKLDEREQFWMDYFKSWDPKIGYNICREAGTTRGRKRPQSEIKNSINHRRTYRGENNPFYGKKHSTETIEKIRDIHLGKKYTGERKIKHDTAMRNSAFKRSKYVNQLSITGDFIKTFPSLASAAKETGASISNISMVANKKRGKTAGGFIWEWTRPNNPSSYQDE